MATVLVGLTVPVPPAVAAPWAGTIDTTNMDAVRDAYLNVYLPGIQVANGWAGDAASCNAGTASAAARDAAISVINYYRALDGLAPVKENAAATGTAQQTALMMFANNTLSHNPPNTWTCYSDTGGAGAGESNLALGYPTVGQSIDGYMDDGGPMPQEVGHRSWLLYPPQSQVGVGIAGNGPGSGYAIQLWGQNGMQNNSRPPGNGTPWPSPGYVPYENLPSQYWSYAEPKAGFGSATVAVTKNGQPLAVSGVTQTTGYGDPKGFWTMPKLTKPGPGTTDSYVVTVSGIKGGHATSVSYTVKVFNAAEVALGDVFVTGTPRVGGVVTASVASVSPGKATLSYEWFVDGVSVGTSSTYQLQPSDMGKSLTVSVTGTYHQGSQKFTNGTAKSAVVTVRDSCYGCFGDGCSQASVCERHTSHWWWWA